MARIGDLFVQIGADARQFTKEIKRVGKDLVTFSNEVKAIGKTVSLNLTAPLVGFAASAIALSDEAQAAFKDFGTKTGDSMRRLGNDLFRSLNIQALLDVVASAVNKAVTAFENLSPAVKGTLLTVGALVAAVGPAILLFGQLAGVMARLQQATLALGVAMNFLRAHPLVLLASAIGLAVAGLTTWIAVSRAAGERASAFGRELLNVEERIRKAAQELKDFEQAGGGGTKLIESIRVRQGRIEQLKKDIDELSRLKAVPADIQILTQPARLELEKLTGEVKTFQAEYDRLRGNLQDQNAQAKAVEVMVRYQGSLAIAQQEMQLTGDTEEYLRSRVEAHTKARKELLPILGAQHQELKAIQDELDFESKQLKHVENDSKAFREAEESLGRYGEATREATLLSEATGGGINLTNVALEEEKRHYIDLVREKGKDNAETQASFDKIQQLTGAMATFKGLMQELPLLGQQIGRALFDMVQQFSQGVGDAVARAIVYGENLAEMLNDLLKEIAASAISVLVQLAVRSVISAAVTAAAWAVAGLFATTLNPFVSLALGAVVAAAAAALVYAAAGSAGAAEGGIFATPGMINIAEKGKPEIVLNQENVRRFFGSAGFNLTPRAAGLDTSAVASIASRGLSEGSGFGQRDQVFGRGGGDLHIHLDADGRELAAVVVPNLPDILRLHGITI